MLRLRLFLVTLCLRLAGALTTLSERLVKLPPRQKPVLPPPPGLPFERKLPSLELGRVDMAFGYIFGDAQFYGSKTADMRWRH